MKKLNGFRNINGNAFHISTNKTDLDLEVSCDFLSNRSYRAKGRSRKTIKTAIENPLCFGVYDAEGKQAGFARVISDQVIFAWLLDVFILEGHRGSGLGKRLLNALMNHSDLRSVRRWGLGTKDAHGLYKKFGFTPLSKPEMMMERVNEKAGLISPVLP